VLGPSYMLDDPGPLSRHALAAIFVVLSLFLYFILFRQLAGPVCNSLLIIHSQISNRLHAFTSQIAQKHPASTEHTHGVSSQQRYQYIERKFWEVSDQTNRRWN
jgi:hypothetical protein